MGSDAWVEVQKRLAKNRNATNSSAEELYSRLVTVTNGSRLTDEARHRTQLVANVPRNGFGMMDRDGWNWMTAVFVLAMEGQQNRLSAMEEENSKLRAQVAQMDARLKLLEGKFQPSTR
jgi:hypothetical protein